MKNHNTVAVGGKPNPTHCPGNPVYWRPGVPMPSVLDHGVPVSCGPSVPLSLRGNETHEQVWGGQTKHTNR